MMLRILFFLTVVFSSLIRGVKADRRSRRSFLSPSKPEAIDENPTARRRQHHHPHHYPYGWGLDGLPDEEKEDTIDDVKEVKHVTHKKKGSSATIDSDAAAAQRKKEEHQEMLRDIVQAYMDNLMFCGLE